jgi:hypothetical protein
MRTVKNSLMLAAWLALVLQVTASSAQDAGSETSVDADTAVQEAVIDDTGSRFSDRQLLLDTFVGDAPERLTSAQQDMQTAQENADAAATDDTATPEEMTELEAELLEAQDALVAVEGEIQSLTDLVAQMSDEQVFALNRSLNNSLASGLLLTLDAGLLQRVIDGDYDKQEVNALLQGLEQESRFLAKRDRFEERVAARGNEESSSQTDQMARMEAKAETQKTKFFAKIDDPDPVASDPVIDAKADATIDEAVDQAVDEAVEEAAKSAARSAARDASKQILKSEARLLAKATTKDAVKEAGKSAESNGKGKAE